MDGLNRFAAPHWALKPQPVERDDGFGPRPPSRSPGADRLHPGKTGRKGCAGREPDNSVQLFGVFVSRGCAFMLEDMNGDPNRKLFNILDRLATIDHLMTVEETSEILSKSVSTIYRMARKKQIPSMVIGGTRMFDPSTIAMWLVKKEPQLAAASRWLFKIAA